MGSGDLGQDSGDRASFERALLMAYATRPLEVSNPCSKLCGGMNDSQSSETSASHSRCTAPVLYDRIASPFSLFSSCNPALGSGNPLEGLIEIGYQIVWILYAAGQSNQSIAASDASSPLGRNGGMRHRCGKTDQAFHAAQRFRQGENLHPFENTRGSLPSAEVHRDHPAKALHLSARQLMLRV